MAKGTRKQGDLEQEIDRLFDLPPEEFTAARDELTKRLQNEERADEARDIKAIRRPTVAAWAVNQLARSRLREVDELLEAGSALQQAQRKVLSGVKSVDFREASERRRAVVTRLVRAAEEILRQSGRGAAGAAEAVRSTLEAASLDDEAGGLVRAGRLSKELPAPASFGAVEGLGLVPAPREEPTPTKKPQRRQREEDEASALGARREEAAREAKERVDAAARARRHAIKARSEADRAEATAERLSTQAEQARAKARDSGKRAQQADVEATRAEDAADRAAKRLEQLEKRSRG